MPSTRYGFSCHTKEDKDLIEALDNFPTVRKRNEEIKRILKNYFLGVTDSNTTVNISDELNEKLDNMTTELSRLNYMVANIKTVQANPETNNDALDDNEAQEAIDNLLGALD